MYTALEAFLQMKAEITITGFSETDSLLWEIGGVEGLIDEALHWAVYRLGVDYKDRGIVVNTMTWDKQGNAITCRFTYSGGTPLDCSDILKDEDFQNYASWVIGSALSVRSLRYYNQEVWAMRLSMRYDGVCLDDYIAKVEEQWRNE